MKPKTKKNKGITLIALVITIIVMLILVGVTLSITLDENGIIEKTKLAAGRQDSGAIKDQLQPLILGKIDTNLQIPTGTLGEITSNEKTYTVSAAAGANPGEIIITITDKADPDNTTGYILAGTGDDGLEITGVTLAQEEPVNNYDWFWENASTVKIATLAGLKYFQQAVNGNADAEVGEQTITDPTFAGITVTLENDIVLDSNWTPIGKDGYHIFSGIFNGNNHTISNVTTFATDEDTDGVGLFGYVASMSYPSTTEISNLKVVGNIDVSDSFVGRNSIHNWKLFNNKL